MELSTIFQRVQSQNITGYLMDCGKCNFDYPSNRNKNKNANTHIFVKSINLLLRAQNLKLNNL